MSLGEPQVFKINDFDFKLEPFNQKIQDQFARYMQSQFLSVIKKNKDLVGGEYLSLLQKFLFDVDQGFYDFGTQNFLDFINSKQHFSYLFFLCFSFHQLINKETVEKWVDENLDEAIILFNKFYETSTDKKKDGNS